MPRVEQAILGRAIKGVPRPIFYKGEQVGEWRHFDERLAMFLLRSRRSGRYGKWTERQLPPHPLSDEATDALEHGLAEIERKAPEELCNVVDDAELGSDDEAGTDDSRA